MQFKVAIKFVLGLNFISYINFSVMKQRDDTPYETIQVFRFCSQRSDVPKVNTD